MGILYRIRIWSKLSLFQSFGHDYFGDLTRNSVPVEQKRFYLGIYGCLLFPFSTTEMGEAYTITLLRNVILQYSV